MASSAVSSNNSWYLIPPLCALHHHVFAVLAGGYCAVLRHPLAMPICRVDSYLEALVSPGPILQPLSLVGIFSTLVPVPTPVLPADSVGCFV